MAFNFTHRPDSGLAGGGMGFSPSGLTAYQGIQDRATSFYEPGRQGQLDAMEMYRQQALGQGGPSAAEMYGRQQAESNARMGMALASRSRGGNLAGMQQQAQGAYAGAQAQTNQDMAALRAQEQLAAQQMYGQMAGQMSEQGLGYGTLAANTLLGGQGLQQDWRLGNRGLDIQQEANNRQFWGGMINAGIGAVGAVAGAGASAGGK